MKQYIKEVLTHLKLTPEKTAHVIISVLAMVASGVMLILISKFCIKSFYLMIENMLYYI